MGCVWYASLLKNKYGGLTYKNRRERDGDRNRKSNKSLRLTNERNTIHQMKIPN